MATKIRILAAAPSPFLQLNRTLKWVLRYVEIDPANVKLQRINQYFVFRLVSIKSGKPVSASNWLRNQLTTQEVELIDS